MRFKKISITWILLFSSIIFITLGTVFVVSINKKENKTKTHSYVPTTITEKRIIPASGGWYWYKDTEYIIVSEGPEGNTITTWVSANIYDSFDIGDTVYYCKTHDKIKNYE